ncbi:MAG: hypothetical protein ACYTEE_05720 [Planctomycetota bacterium]|jgi:hypothetical protein
MSPNIQQRGPKVAPANNIYTALLGLVLLVLLATLAFVAFKYYSFYQFNFPILK